MNTKNVTIGVLIVAVLIFVGLSFRTKDTITQIKTNTVGAISGPDFMSPYYSVGGVYTYKTGKALATATTTPCSLISPSSTSTLMSAAIQISTASSTAITIRVATSSTAFATTTALNWFALASGALGSFSYTSTSSASSAYMIMSPNTYVVWSLDGIIGSDTTKLNGSCFATWNVN